MLAEVLDYPACPSLGDLTVMLSSTTPSRHSAALSLLLPYITDNCDECLLRQLEEEEAWVKETKLKAQQSAGSSSIANETIAADGKKESQKAVSRLFQAFHHISLSSRMQALDLCMLLTTATHVLSSGWSIFGTTSDVVMPDAPVIVNDILIRIVGEYYGVRLLPVPASSASSMQRNPSPENPVGRFDHIVAATALECLHELEVSHPLSMLPYAAAVAALFRMSATTTATAESSPQFPASEEWRLDSEGVASTGTSGREKSHHHRARGEKESSKKSSKKSKQQQAADKHSAPTTAPMTPPSSASSSAPLPVSYSSPSSLQFLLRCRRSEVELHAACLLSTISAQALHLAAVSVASAAAAASSSSHRGAVHPALAIAIGNAVAPDAQQQASSFGASSSRQMQPGPSPAVSVSNVPSHLRRQRQPRSGGASAAAAAGGGADAWSSSAGQQSQQKDQPQLQQQVAFSSSITMNSVPCTVPFIWSLARRKRSSSSSNSKSKTLSSTSTSTRSGSTSLVWVPVFGDATTSSPYSQLEAPQHQHSVRFLHAQLADALCYFQQRACFAGVQCAGHSQPAGGSVTSTSGMSVLDLEQFISCSALLVSGGAGTPSSSSSSSSSFWSDARRLASLRLEKALVPLSSSVQHPSPSQQEKPPSSIVRQCWGVSAVLSSSPLVLHSIVLKCLCACEGSGSRNEGGDDLEVTATASNEQRAPAAVEDQTQASSHSDETESFATSGSRSSLGASAKQHSWPNSPSANPNVAAHHQQTAAATPTPSQSALASQFRVLLYCIVHGMQNQPLDTTMRARVLHFIPLHYSLSTPPTPQQQQQQQQQQRRTFYLSPLVKHVLPVPWCPWSSLAMIRLQVMLASAFHHHHHQQQQQGGAHALSDNMQGLLLAHGTANKLPPFLSFVRTLWDRSAAVSQLSSSLLSIVAELAVWNLNCSRMAALLLSACPVPTAIRALSAIVDLEEYLSSSQRNTNSSDEGTARGVDESQEQQQQQQPPSSSASSATNSPVATTASQTSSSRGRASTGQQRQQQQLGQSQQDLASRRSHHHQNSGLLKRWSLHLSGYPVLPHTATLTQLALHVLANHLGAQLEEFLPIVAWSLEDTIAAAAAAATTAGDDDEAAAVNSGSGVGNSSGTAIASQVTIQRGQTIELLRGRMYELTNSFDVGNIILLCVRHFVVGEGFRLMTEQQEQQQHQQQHNRSYVSSTMDSFSVVQRAQSTLRAVDKHFSHPALALHSRTMQGLLSHLPLHKVAAILNVTPTDANDLCLQSERSDGASTSAPTKHSIALRFAPVDFPPRLVEDHQDEREEEGERSSSNSAFVRLRVQVSRCDRGNNDASPGAAKRQPHQSSLPQPSGSSKAAAAATKGSSSISGVLVRIYTSDSVRDETTMVGSCPIPLLSGNQQEGSGEDEAEGVSTIEFEIAVIPPNNGDFELFASVFQPMLNPEHIPRGDERVSLNVELARRVAPVVIHTAADNTTNNNTPQLPCKSQRNLTQEEFEKLVKLQQVDAVGCANIFIAPGIVVQVTSDIAAMSHGDDGEDENDENEDSDDDWLADVEVQSNGEEGAEGATGHQRKKDNGRHFLTAVNCNPAGVTLTYSTNNFEILPFLDVHFDEVLRV